MHTSAYNENDILAGLDLMFNEVALVMNPYGPPEAARTHLDYTFFLDLEHGYCETAGSRIHLFADADRWAIVMEKSGYMNRAGRIEAELIYIGNCISYPMDDDGNTSNMAIVEIVGGDELQRIENTEGEEMECFERIGKDVREIVVKGRNIPYDNDYRNYERLGIDVRSEENPDRLIGFGDLIRYLHATSPAAVRSTEDELRGHIPDDLPKLMTIDDFEHRSIYSDPTPPSRQETYQLVARVLATRDTSNWRPTRTPNNHWKNWESGTM